MLNIFFIPQLATLALMFVCLLPAGRPGCAAACTDLRCLNSGAVVPETSGNTAPTINLGSTTPYLSPTAVSGVIGDPTDPAATIGILVTLNDAETEASSLLLSAVSSNQSVVPDAGLSLSCSGTERTLFITPAGVGYAAITLTVTDGGGLTAAAIINYAASAASITPATSRFLTGSSDSSEAFTLGADYMLVGDDENQVLRIYNRDHSGLPLGGFDFTAQMGLANGTGEVDIESGARLGSRIYWLGSMGNSKSGDLRPDRNRLFATDLSDSGSATVLSFAGYYNGLRGDLIAWDHTNLHGKSADYFGFTARAAAGVIPEEPDGSGFNIEGAEFAPDNASLYLGFRAPIAPAASRTRALIVPLMNPAALVSGMPGSGPATFGEPILLNLGDRGIRAMRRNAANQYLIIAGPPDGATGAPGKDFKFYSWTGNRADLPVPHSADLTALDTGGSFECIVETPNPLTEASRIQLLSDMGDTCWYGDGIAAKELSQNNFKKSRSDNITLGSAEANVPYIETFVVPATAAGLTFPVAVAASDDIAVTGYLVTESASQPAAGAAGWSASAPGFFTVAGEGSHNLYAWAKNGAGKVSNLYAPRTVVVDITAPDTGITQCLAEPVVATSVSFSFHGSDSAGSGMAGFECRLDGSPWSACQSPISYDNLTLDNHTFEVRALDKAGNADATPAACSWLVTGSTACIDEDGDGYGDGCAAGTDCDDGNAAMHDNCTQCTVRVLPQHIRVAGEREAVRLLLVIGPKGSAYDENTQVAWDNDALRTLHKLPFFNRFMLVKINLDGAQLEKDKYTLSVDACTGAVFVNSRISPERAAEK